MLIKINKEEIYSLQFVIGRFHTSSRLANLWKRMKIKNDPSRIYDQVGVTNYLNLSEIQVKYVIKGVEAIL